MHVDDIVLTGTETAEINDLKAYLHSTFKIKDLGMEFLDTDEGVVLSHREVVMDKLKEYDCLSYTSFSSPL